MDFLFIGFFFFLYSFLLFFSFFFVLFHHSYQLSHAALPSHPHLTTYGFFKKKTSLSKKFFDISVKSVNLPNVRYSVNLPNVRYSVNLPNVRYSVNLPKNFFKKNLKIFFVNFFLFKNFFLKKNFENLQKV